MIDSAAMVLSRMLAVSPGKADAGFGGGSGTCGTAPLFTGYEEANEAERSNLHLFCFGLGKVD